MDPFTIGLAIATWMYGAYSSQESGKEAREQTKKQAALDRQAAKDRATAQLAADGQMAFLQAETAMSQLEFNQANALAQMTFQQQQDLLTREQMASAEFEASQAELKGQEEKDKLFYEKALQTITRKERSDKLRRQDTILTQPLETIGDTPDGAVTF